MFGNIFYKIPVNLFRNFMNIKFTICLIVPFQIQNRVRKSLLIFLVQGLNFL